MRSVEEHRAAVLSLVQVPPTVYVPVPESAGLALAADVSAPFPLPAFDNSAMDGYAVRAPDTARVPVVLPVTGVIPAGRYDRDPLTPGTARRIMTGAPVPPGADAVVPVEWTDGGVDRVTIERAPEPGANIRLAGEDLTAGETALRAGDEITPARVGLLAALGHARVPVRRRPRLAVLPTGSELVEPGDHLEPGRIHDANGYLLTAAARAAGAEVTLLSAVGDDPDAFGARVDSVLDHSDLLLTSGGISAGAFEVVRDTFGPTGTVEFGRVAMRPGQPQGLGTVGPRAVPLIAVPGNPVSAFVSFEVFVRPALRAMLGHRDLDRPAVRATLTDPLGSRPGRAEYRRGWFDPRVGTVRLVGGAGSHLLGALARANCLVEVPEDVDGLDRGAEVTVRVVD